MKKKRKEKSCSLNGCRYRTIGPVTIAEVGEIIVGLFAYYARKREGRSKVKFSGSR